jgi:hypothetical protein
MPSRRVAATAGAYSPLVGHPRKAGVPRIARASLHDYVGSKPVLCPDGLGRMGSPAAITMPLQSWVPPLRRGGGLRPHVPEPSLGRLKRWGVCRADAAWAGASTRLPPRVSNSDLSVVADCRCRGTLRAHHDEPSTHQSPQSVHRLADEKSHDESWRGFLLKQRWSCG